MRGDPSCSACASDLLPDFGPRLREYARAKCSPFASIGSRLVANLVATLYKRVVHHPWPTSYVLSVKRAWQITAGEAIGNAFASSAFGIGAVFATVESGDAPLLSVQS